MVLCCFLNKKRNSLQANKLSSWNVLILDMKSPYQSWQKLCVDWSKMATSFLTKIFQQNSAGTFIYKLIDDILTTNQHLLVILDWIYIVLSIQDRLEPDPVSCSGGPGLLQQMAQLWSQKDSHCQPGVRAAVERVQQSRF